jgi:hypothetical protein
MSKKQKIFNQLLMASWCLLGVALLAGCASSSPSAAEKAEQKAAAKAARTPYGKLIAEAAAYLIGLTEQDQLPGIRKNEHGSIESTPEVLGEGAVSYPASVVFRLAKDGDASVYRYTVVKQDPTAPWQLIKATREDKSGQVVADLLAR